jgi:hypothetical protein
VAGSSPDCSHVTKFPQYLNSSPKSVFDDRIWLQVQASDYLAIKEHVKEVCGALVERLFPGHTVKKNKKIKCASQLHNKSMHEVPTQVRLPARAAQFSHGMVILLQETKAGMQVCAGTKLGPNAVNNSELLRAYISPKTS